MAQTATTTPTPTPARKPAFVTKAREPSFDFGFNVASPRRQTRADRQAFAMARGKGGPLRGVSGS